MQKSEKQNGSGVNFEGTSTISKMISFGYTIKYHHIKTYWLVDILAIDTKDKKIETKN